MNARQEALAAAGALAVAVALSVALVPSEDPAPATGFTWLRGEPVVDSAVRHTRLLLDTVGSATRTWERLDSEERSRGIVASGLGLRVDIDRGVPDTIASAFTRLARDEFRAIAPEPSHAVVLRVLIDPERDFRFRRATILPGSPEAPCVVLIRVSPNTASFRLPRRSGQLLGVCGLYARFGAPGSGMVRWLDRTEQEFALRHTFGGGIPRERMRFEPSFLQYSTQHASCLNRNLKACESLVDRSPVESWGSEVLLYGVPRSRPVSVPRVAVVGAEAIDFGETFDRISLAGLRHSLGDERFRAIWMSDREPSEAFLAAEGVPLGSWVRDQLLVEVAPYRAGGMPSGAPLWSAIVLTGLFAVAAVRLARRVYTG